MLFEKRRRGKSFGKTNKQKKHIRKDHALSDLGKQAARFRELKQSRLSLTTRSGGPASTPCVAVWGELQEHSSSESTALEDKQLTNLSETFTSPKKTSYFHSFIFDTQ